MYHAHVLSIMPTPSLHTLFIFDEVCALERPIESYEFESQLFVC